MSDFQLPSAKLINTSKALVDLVRTLKREPLIALDTESNSLYAYYEQVCLIQLSTRQTDYLIDPLAIDDLSPLGEITANPNIEIVFHAAEYDVACLKRDFEFQFNNIFDTMTGARVLAMPQVGLAKLLDKYFQVEHDKRFQRADWGQRPLSPAHQHYAQIDTHFLPALRDIIREQLIEQGSLEEAQELFDELCDTRIQNHVFDPDGFWLISDTRKFSLRQMACLRELYLWREEIAERRNLPRFKVMTDEKLVQIVQANPQSLKELINTGLLPRNTAERQGVGLLKALANGRKAPIPSRPQPPQVDANTLRRHELLKDWRKKRALERGVESDIIVRREALWTLAKEAPSSLEELDPILGPWRKARYGQEILQVLNTK